MSQTTDLRLYRERMFQTSKFLHVRMRSLRQYPKRRSHSKLQISNFLLSLLPSQQASITRLLAFSPAYSHSRQDFQCLTKACSLRRPDSCPLRRQPDTTGLVHQCHPCRAALPLTCLHSKQEADLFKRSRPEYRDNGVSSTPLQLVCRTLKLFNSG